MDAQMMTRLFGMLRLKTSSTFRLFYRAYFRLMTWPFRIRKGKPAVQETTRAPVQQSDLAAADAQASALGETYRGAGVFIYSVGATVVLLSVLPSALGLGHQAETAIGVLKIALMIAGPSMAIGLDRKKLHDQWIEARQRAETARYARLLSCIEAATDLQQGAVSALFDELKSVLDGPGGQIHYNQCKSEDYAFVSRLTSKISWAGFGAALCAACSQLIWKMPVLLLVTAFVPALVGTLHGINGFLRIGDLEDEHREMADRLSQIRERLSSSECTDDRETIRHAGVEAYQLLCSGNDTWLHIARKQIAAAV